MGLARVIGSRLIQPPIDLLIVFIGLPEDFAHLEATFKGEGREEEEVESTNRRVHVCELVRIWA